MKRDQFNRMFQQQQLEQAELDRKWRIWTESQMQERLMNEAMMRNKSLSIADQSMGSSYVPANSGPQLNPPTISSFTRYAAIDDDIIIQEQNSII